MTRLLQRIHRDHRHFARLMDLLEALLDMFKAGEEPSYELLCELLEYLEIYADHVHHPAEELIFDRLKEAGVRHPVLDILSRQHAGLGQINKRFRCSLEGIVHSEVLRREDVERQGRELVAAMREHMRLEDEEAFPIALERLDEAAWDELLATAPNAGDPVFGNPDPARFKALLEQLADQVDD